MIRLVEDECGDYPSVHLELTVQTPSGLTYTIIRPDGDIVAIGDAWPPAAKK